MLVEVKVVRNEKQCGVNDGWWPGRGIARGAITVIAVAFALAIVAAPRTAHAYRTFADDPEVNFAAAWSAPVAFDLATTTLPAEVDGAGFEAAMSRATSAWGAPACSTLRIGYRSDPSGAPAAADGRNTVAFILSGWASMGLAPDRGAVTDTRVERDASGAARIVEADILLNAEGFDFVDADVLGGDLGPDQLDLATVLRHELAHAIGLLHPCELTEGPAPLCSVTPGAELSAIYPVYPGVLAMALSTDDVDGLCSLYPLARPCDPLCAAGYECQAGSCAPVRCADGGCGHFCTPEACLMSRPCSLDEPCTGETCALGSPLAGMCVGLGTQGASCRLATDCESRLCLTSSRLGTYCTTGCTDTSDCGSGEVCSAVDGRSVCAPMPRSSCSAASYGASLSHNRGLSQGLFLLAIIGVSLASRRRYRPCP